MTLLGEKYRTQTPTWLTGPCGWFLELLLLLLVLCMFWLYVAYQLSGVLSWVKVPTATAFHLRDKGTELLTILPRCSWALTAVNDVMSDDSLNLSPSLFSFCGSNPMPHLIYYKVAFCHLLPVVWEGPDVQEAILPMQWSDCISPWWRRKEQWLWAWALTLHWLVGITYFSKLSKMWSGSVFLF